MSDPTAVFLTPPQALGLRVRDVDGGLTFEEMLAKSDAIVERSAAQWRLATLMDVELLLNLTDRARADPPELGPALPLLFGAAGTIEDQAATRGLAGVRAAAAALRSYLSGLDAEGGNLGDPRRHISIIERSIDMLQAALVEGAHGRMPDTGSVLAAD